MHTTGSNARTVPHRVTRAVGYVLSAMATAGYLTESKMRSALARQCGEIFFGHAEEFAIAAIAGDLDLFESDFFFGQ